MPMLNYKSFRRRWILLFILVVGCIVLLSNNLSKNSSLIEDDYETKHAIRRQPFQWKPNLPDVVSNNSTKIVPCRNSVQGKLIIVDERGYICNRTELDNRGCCDVTLQHISKHRCDKCSSNGCCEQFEFCVSCCLNPEKKTLLTRVLEEARQLGDRSLASVGDQFELCLAKCRTSSQSVQHENSYRNPKAKYCYGGNPPELLSLTS
ncbi:SREBP regulating gene protein-like [Mytilus edulis]|uniref:SREBP regulating gene protein-like n=1 Tax=Mytilus edulis TaxID=6550 RepID=UPI0039F00265